MPNDIGDDIGSDIGGDCIGDVICGGIVIGIVIGVDIGSDIGIDIIIGLGKPICAVCGEKHPMGEVGLTTTMLVGIFPKAGDQDWFGLHDGALLTPGMKICIGFIVVFNAGKVTPIGWGACAHCETKAPVFGALFKAGAMFSVGLVSDW